MAFSRNSLGICQSWILFYCLLSYFWRESEVAIRILGVIRRNPYIPTKRNRPKLSGDGKQVKGLKRFWEGPMSAALYVAVNEQNYGIPVGMLH